MYEVPEPELRFHATRARGPGGQHVNKASTRVEVVWDLARSPSLTEGQRDRLRKALAARLDTRGRLRIASDRFRSQVRNRHDAIGRLQALVQQGLRVPKPRRTTKPPGRAVEGRLREKRARADRKRSRGPVTDDD